MNTKRITTKKLVPALIGLSVLVAGCGGRSGDSGMSPRSSTSTTPAARTSEANAEKDMVPGQSEFDAQATKSINAQNADAEYEKLKQEIENDG